MAAAAHSANTFVSDRFWSRHLLMKRLSFHKNQLDKNVYFKIKTAISKQPLEALFLAHSQSTGQVLYLT